MHTIRTLFDNEAALGVALLEAVLVVAVAFGFNLDGAQVAALVALLIPVGGVLTRSRVWNRDSVAHETDAAYQRGLADGTGPGPIGVADDR